MTKIIKNHQKMQNLMQNESGRSMVEMLGVLAVIGVLSVGAISGYRYAMNKYRANQVTNELNLLSHQVAIAMMSKNGVTELKLGEPYDSGRLTSGYALAFGCGAGESNADCQGETKYYIQVGNLSKSVCQELEKTHILLQFSDTVTGGSCEAEQNNSLVFAFNVDKGANENEIPEADPEVSKEYESDDPQMSVFDGDDECLGHGYWDGQYCFCNGDWGGKDCSIKNACSGHGQWDACGSRCSCEEGYSGDACSIDKSCSGHGSWQGSYCSCISGWSGIDCAQTSEEACFGHGTWQDSYCSCSTGWGGDDCLKCSGHGYSYTNPFYNGKCACKSGYRGDDCEIEDPNVCSGHGWLLYGACACDDGWGGTDCSKGYREACSNRGTWEINWVESTSSCSCDSGWTGTDCSMEK